MEHTNGAETPLVARRNSSRRLSGLSLTPDDTERLREFGDKVKPDDKRYQSRNSLLFKSMARKFIDQQQTVGSKVSSCNDRTLLTPSSKFRVSWDLIMMLLLVYLIFVVPFRVGFEVDPETGSPLAYLEGAMDIFFMADVFLNFRTGYITESGDEEMRPNRIAKRYLRGFFFIDFVSSVPLDYIFIGTEVGNLQVLKAGKLAKISRLLKIAKLTRLLKMQQYLEKFEDDIRISKLKIKLLTLLSGTFLIAHWNACGWAMISRFNDSYYSLSWQLAYNVIDGGVSSEYLASLYFSIMTMSTVGFGDIVPQSDAERMYCIISMVFGGGFYGFIIATLSSVVTQTDANSKNKAEKLEAVNLYMRLRRFPKDLRQKVKRFYMHYYDRRTALDEDMILSELSPHLRHEVALFLIDKTVSHISLFKNLAPHNYAKLVTILNPVRAEEGEFLMRAGETGTEMYILISGQLEVLGVDEKKVICILSNGAFFGELCALGLALQRTSSVRAISTCEMYSLSREDLFAAFAHQEPATLVNMIEMTLNQYDDIKLENDVVVRRGTQADENSETRKKIVKPPRKTGKLKSRIGTRLGTIFRPLKPVHTVSSQSNIMKRIMSTNHATVDAANEEAVMHRMFPTSDTSDSIWEIDEGSSPSLNSSNISKSDSISSKPGEPANQLTAEDSEQSVLCVNTLDDLGLEPVAESTTPIQEEEEEEEEEEEHDQPYQRALPLHRFSDADLIFKADDSCEEFEQKLVPNRRKRGTEILMNSVLNDVEVRASEPNGNVDRNHRKSSDLPCINAGRTNTGKAQTTEKRSKNTSRKISAEGVLKVTQSEANIQDKNHRGSGGEIDGGDKQVVGMLRAMMKRMDQLESTVRSQNQVLQDHMINTPPQQPSGHSPDDLVGTMLPGRNILRATAGAGDRNIEQLLQEMMNKRATAKFQRDKHARGKGGHDSKSSLKLASKHVIMTNRLIHAFGGASSQVQPINEKRRSRPQLLVSPGSKRR